MNRRDGAGSAASGAPAAHDRAVVGPEPAAAVLDEARRVKAALVTEGGVVYGPGADEAVSRLDRVSAGLLGLDPMRRLTTRWDALAFWINVYNALVIHGALRFRVSRRMTEIPGFFRRAAYDIGGRVYNLDVIEHGILRGNRGHPLRVVVPQLMPWDRRRGLVLRPFDARIHFALNCGAVSCPPLRHYTADHIDDELELAARSFVAGGGVAVDPEGGGVRLSRIFLWYARDFGWTKRRQLRSVIGYLDGPERAAVEAAAERGIRYAAYDWSFA